MRVAALAVPLILASCATSGPPAASGADDRPFLHLVHFTVPPDNVETFEDATALMVEAAGAAGWGREDGWLFYRVEGSRRRDPEYVALATLPDLSRFEDPDAWTTAIAGTPGEAALEEARSLYALTHVEVRNQIARRVRGEELSAQPEVFMEENQLRMGTLDTVSELLDRFLAVAGDCFATVGFYEGVVGSPEGLLMLAGAEEVQVAEECVDRLPVELDREIERLMGELELLTLTYGQESLLHLLPDLSHLGEPRPPEDVATERQAREERRYAALMTLDLRNLLTAQEIYYGTGNYRYTDDLEVLRDEVRWSPSEGVTVHVTVADEGRAFQAVAEHAETSITCAVFEGDVEPIAPATRAGEVSCTEPD